MSSAKCNSANKVKGWPLAVLDIFTGFQKSQILFVTTELQLYDLLENCDGGMTAFEIASKKNLNSDATERILDYAAGLKLIRKNVESNPATYSNIPDVADVLQTCKPNNMVGAVLHASHIKYPLFQHLMAVIKDGNNKQAYKNAFGFEVTSETFDAMYSQSRRDIGLDYSEIFTQFMHNSASVTAPGIAKAFDLTPFKRICDLGGGSGALAYALAREYPDASVEVFDLPAVIKSGKNFRPDNAKKLKVEFVAGDFFKDDFPQADLYVFSRTIHDWEEDKVHLLLEKAFNSLKSGGAVLLAEQLLNETKTGPLNALLHNIQMLVVQTGRERTEKEYRQLMEQHGFADFRCQFVMGYIGMHVMLVNKP